MTGTNSTGPILFSAAGDPGPVPDQHAAAHSERTALVLVLDQDQPGLPRLAWTGTAAAGLDAADIVSIRERGTLEVGNHGGDRHSVSLLPEVAGLWFGRPGLAGHRIGGTPVAGLDWATSFQTLSLDERPGQSLVVEAADTRAELRPGHRDRDGQRRRPAGAAHADQHRRAAVRGRSPRGRAAAGTTAITEALDLTGRWARERAPQRHPIADGAAGCARPHAAGPASTRRRC